MYRNVDYTNSELLKMREEGLTNQQIADVVGCNILTVRNRIGKQPTNKERTDAFRERRERVLAASEIFKKPDETEEKPKEEKPKPDIEPIIQTFGVGDTRITVDYTEQSVRIWTHKDDDPDSFHFGSEIAFENVTEFVRTLAYILREQINGKAVKE